MTTLPTIMIADDDPDFRELISDYLQGAGYSVIVARDGSEAMRLATEKVPDVILLDVMMPGSNGFDVCKHIRDNDRTKETSVIMLTMRDKLDDKLAGYLSGAHRFLTKDCELADINTCLKSVLKQRSLREFHN